MKLRILLAGAMALACLGPPALAQTFAIGDTSAQRTAVPTVSLDATGHQTGTAANPLPVTAAAGSAVIGKFGIDQTTPGTTNLVAVTPTGGFVAATPAIQNAAYASGNCMGGFQTVALGSTASILSQISVASQGGLATAKQIYVFSANPSGSTCTDKSTFTIATADLPKLIWSGSITPAAPTGTTKSWGNAPSLALGIPSGGTVYVAMVDTTTETPATTTDLTLGFSVF